MAQKSLLFLKDAEDWPQSNEDIVRITLDDPEVKQDVLVIVGVTEDVNNATNKIFYYFSDWN